MEDCSEETVLQEKKEGEEAETGQDADESERGRPSTPKWWRPPIPPETYQWEEVRRQRQKGGYPWTHLDKDEEIDADDYLDENLYEPVNPPPLYGNESYLSKDLQQVPQMEDKMIEIPPEIEILTSEGLDGLDKPDPHDTGFDGDREWQNTSEDEGHHSRLSFTAGMRKPGESRSTTPKSVGFSPDTITHETSVDEDLEEQEVPVGGDAEAASSSAPRGRRSRSSSPGGKKQTAFDILKSKAVDAADHVKQRIKSAIPVRPKFTKSRKRRKVKHGQEEQEGGEQEVPEDTQMKDPDAETEEQGSKPEDPPEQVGEEKIDSGEAVQDEPDASPDTGENLEEDGETSIKQQEKDEKELKKAEEKAAKLKAAEEAKQAKLEEKLAKAREAEEKRQAKADEEKRKQEEKEEAARKAAEAKKEEEARKAAEKAAKEEEARIAAEAKKAEEEARKAAEKAKKEEEARKRAEAKKIEEERKAAEKAKKEEEARLAAEAKKAEEERKIAEKRAKAEAAKKAAAEKKAAEEEARKADEAKKAEEEAARKEEEAKRAAEEAAIKAAAAEAGEDSAVVETTNEEAQPMDTTEEGVEGAAAQGEVVNEEDMETIQPQTPSGTTKRKYIRHRKGTPTHLSQLPNPIASLRNQVEDFKNKLKRSRTPPRRPIQRKHRRSRSADASKSPPRDPDDISNRGEDELEEEIVATGDGGEVQELKQPDQEPTLAEELTVCVQTEANTDAPPEKSTESLQQSSTTAEEESGPPAEESEPTPSGTGTTERKRRLRQQPAKEKLDKIGQHLKGLGANAIEIASQATKGVGQTLKVVGKLGAKAVGELKPKSETSKSKTDVQECTTELGEEDVTPAPPPPAEAEPPKRTFRFKRRNESQEEGDEELEQEDQEHFYENAQAEQDANSRNAFLGSGARDWESPQDRVHSRGVSEERFSANVSSRDSPPGSSLASSTIAQVRRTGVLEEIDSDEFFLRERGISEGEDEEEVNRFLVEELRQAFRPSLSNALAGFDMEPPLAPPPRPERAPRKPPRKEKENATSAAPSIYQTFPPERPKRKEPQGYVSKFMKEHEGEEEEGEYSGSNEEVRGSMGDMEGELEENDAIQMVKDKLSELDQELEDTDTAVEPVDESNTIEKYEDDGRYEPINEGPTKPTRTKRKQPKRPPTPPTFYYNTIAGNEWLRELEEHTQGSEPAPPVRKRRGSGKSSSIPPGSDDGRDFRGENIPTYSEPNQSAGASVQESGNEDNADYVDEAGYAIVQRDRGLPKTIPRKKKKRTNISDQTGPVQAQDSSFFSLPRGGSSNETPPTRPHRTYSTLRPRRPPRSKSGSRQNLDQSGSPVPGRREGDEPRPSTAIGIMQGRPLPPPPRPQRSPAPLNDLDQDSIEMSVGLRHYANFEDIESRPLEEVLTSPPRVIEVDIACQTDPVPDDEFIIGLPEATQTEDSGRIRAASSRLESQETQQEEAQRSPSTTTAGDVSSSFQTSPPPQHTRPSDSFPTNPSPTPFTFPTKLHLEQLEVDFLRVNDLCAQSIKVENLQASQLEVNSISASGPVCASRIQTESLNSDDVNCSRLSSDTIDMPSIPPSSFFQFSSPSPAKPGSEQELCLKTEEKEDKENESACPPDLFDSVNNLLENVDSTNDLKSSHVAEKIVDKQLNLLDSFETEETSKPERKDASVGTGIPSTVPPTQLNNLNQTSSLPTTFNIESAERFEPATEVSSEREILRSSNQSQTTGASQVETTDEIEDEPEEENVVCGSYTLPYSYMSPPLPSPTTGPTRTSSLKKNQRSADSVPKTPPTPRRSDAHIAFGHTSVAQGDVLSVKLSIPVERASIGAPQNASVTRTQPRPQGMSSPSHLPESTTSQADSSKKDAQKKIEAERKSVSPSTTSTAPVAPPAPTKQIPSPLPPPLDIQGDSTDEESFFATSARLGRAVLRFTMRALQAMADYIDTAASEDPSKAEQQRANMQVLLCLLLFLLVGLILATTRSGPYSSPRWEFLMPPPDL